MITLCVLTYADFSMLARRCIEPIAALCHTTKGSGLIDEVRIAANTPSNDLINYNLDAVRRIRQADVPSHLFAFIYNKYKWPVLRSWLHTQDVSSKLFAVDIENFLATGGEERNQLPIETISSEYLMWFDDDSYIRDTSKEWLQSVIDKMHDCDVLGSVYRSPVSSRTEWFKKQSWFKKPFATHMNRAVINFATGGWWVARTKVLKDIAFPPSELRHNGGDSLLGEMLRQYGYQLKHDRCNVAINADTAGRESHATRRGYSESPIGYPGY